MRANRTPGSVRGAPGNRCPYLDIIIWQIIVLEVAFDGEVRVDHHRGLAYRSSGAHTYTVLGLLLSCHCPFEPLVAALTTVRRNVLPRRLACVGLFLQVLHRCGVLQVWVGGVRSSRLGVLDRMISVKEAVSLAIVLDSGSVVADGPVTQLLNNEELMLAHGLERPHILRHRHPHGEQG